MLKYIIEALEKADQTKIVKHGFGKPMSYRGFYEELAFEPAENVTVASMLEHAKSALGQTFEGYKGGMYTMNGYTRCWISPYGISDNNLIGPILLDYMLNSDN